MGLELEHFRRRVMLLLLTRVGGVLAEVAYLVLALHPPQRLPEETPLLLTKSLDPAQLLLPTISPRPIAERPPFALSIRNISIVLSLDTHRPVARELT